MEERNQINTMLLLMQQPAFWVEDGSITCVNQAAAAYFLEPGQAFAPMILSGREEYADFSAGALYVTLSLMEQPIGACISQLEQGQIVTLEQPAEQPQLQAMALAAKALREPLSSVLSLAERMLPTVAAENAELETQAAQMNRRLYQLLRIVSNMSDAAAYAHTQSVRMEAVEICAFLEEILEKAAALAQQSGIRLTYELPSQAIFTQADSEKLERALYNLLSNAMKFAAPDTAVHTKLVCKNKRLYISVSNSHTGPGPQGNVYTRFLREPALEDGRNGVGLGMVLVRSTAALHGGAVLVDQTADGTRFTMTLQLRSQASSQVHSPVMRFDYAGERDHCLLELSDVLPAQLYGADALK